MRSDILKRLERLENDHFITHDGIEAVFITIVDNTKEGAGQPLPVFGWQFQRYSADDVITMRGPSEDDDALRARHMEAVRPFLSTGSVPLFLPITEG